MPISLAIYNSGGPLTKMVVVPNGIYWVASDIFYYKYFIEEIKGMIFEDITNFTQKVSPSVGDNERQAYGNIAKVCDLFYSIHKGCGCSRNQRIEAANNSYKNLVNMTDEEKMWVKGLFNGEELVFKHDNNIFLTI